MRILSLVAMLCGLALAGCGPIYETQFDYRPPSSGQGLVCTSQCTRIADLCRENCELRNERCVDDARRRARRDWDDYVREREAKNAPLKRSRESFDYTSSCSASSCKSECTTPYNQCFTSCGGEITSRQVCTAFCQ